MIAVNTNNAQRVYAALQFIYWMTYALLFAYASAFLQDKGFTNTEIGLVVGGAYLLASVLQPVFAALYNRAGLSIERCMSAIVGTVILLAAVTFFVKPGKPLTAALTFVIMGTYAAVQPGINALVQRWEKAGCRLNFGTARSIGTLAYAIMSFGFGQLLKKLSPGLVPLFSAISAAVVATVLLLLRAPVMSAGQDGTAGGGSQAGEEKQGPAGRFIFVIIGIGFLIYGHSSFDCFLLQILQNAGGNASNVGTAILVGASVEILVMCLYERLAKRFGNSRLLVFAACMWAVKLFATYLAAAPGGVYTAELFQALSFAIYTPAIVSYVNEHYTGEENLKWLSLTGSAYTVGSVLASFCGGYILDAAGVSVMLLIATGAICVGAGLFAFYFIPAGRNERRKEKSV